MLKNSLSNYLISYSLGFLSCFFIFYFGNKKNGVRPIKSNIIKVEEAKIDSLVFLEKISETKIQNYKVRKQSIKKKYEKDTIALSNTSFDSLAIIFTSYYPSK